MITHIDKETNCLTVIDWDHSRIHDGVHFFLLDFISVSQIEAVK